MTRVMARPHSHMHFVNGENVDRLSAGMTEDSATSKFVRLTC